MIAGLVAVVLVAAGAVAFVEIRRPLPQTSGSLTLPGLDGEVLVRRDARGVPQITAETPEDLFRAQGFVNAQDRFFEMDFRRHVTAGRLAELVGADASAISADRVVRTMGWRRIAEQEWDLVSATTREYLQAYADGVNAYLDQRSGDELALEYTVLGLQVAVDDPEPWTGIDSLAWLKAMAWDLIANFDDEVARGATYSAVRDVSLVDQLFPPYPQDVNAPILTAAQVQGSAARTTSARVDLAAPDLQRALASAEAALSAVPNLLGEGEGTGSNAWVVAGRFTESGKPLLANDPHLSISAPGIWTQIGLHCADVGPECPFDVSGFSFAGFPGVIIGHNADLAWGLTNLRADVSDLFLERVQGDETLAGDTTSPITERTESIKVNGSDDVPLTIRTTRHGPIVSGVLPMSGVTTAPVPEGSPFGRYEVALAWTALQPGRTADAVFAFDQASTPEDIAAAAALFEAPTQSIVYATTSGTIGYQAPGKIPVRAAVAGGPVPSDGSWPRPGWDPAYDWQGYVPAAEMPAVQDPVEGFLVTANQAVTPSGLGPFLTDDWDYGYRAQRIRDLLTGAVEGDPVDVADMTAIQADDHNPFAEMLVPHLVNLPVGDSFDDDGQELLEDWDMRSDVDSAAAAYFSAVWATVLRLTFWDDLPQGYEPTGGSRWLEVVRGLVEEPDASWWDDRSTVGVVEGRDEILTRALVSARRQLTAELGKDASAWRWGRLHTAAPQHPVLGGESVPGLVRNLVNPGPIAVPGGSSIVTATSWDASSGSFGVTSAPSMRMVVDLADLDASRWVNLTGSSGHPGSVHYTDQLAAWAHGETYPWPYSAEAVVAATDQTLTLRPSS